jgi:hypothetical protein
LLELTPLTRNEADELAQISESVRTIAFVEAKGDWADPSREKVNIRYSAVNRIWEQITDWCKKQQESDRSLLNEDPFVLNFFGTLRSHSSSMLLSYGNSVLICDPLSLSKNDLK